jgi:hypothetical protein
MHQENQAYQEANHLMLWPLEPRILLSTDSDHRFLRHLGRILSLTLASQSSLMPGEAAKTWLIVRLGISNR